ncbi:MAG: methylamine utilization protein [Woeseiaceae bacterium]|nr:methylamine utilization protein [Woeseiaceae bacterium]
MSGWFLPRHICCALIALLGMNVAVAGVIEVRVVGSDGQPVQNVAVFIKQAGVPSTAGETPEPVVMDQRDVRVVPHILIVEKGALVSFPNSDAVAHHVYSFSRPNNFVLPLYKGTPPAPVEFAHDGVVTLGCNIHDDMLGYIVVVDTPVFGLTDEHGSISLSVDDAASNYEINIWSPRIRDSNDPLVQSVSAIPADDVTFKLQKSLRPPHDGQSESVGWDEY